MAGRNIDEKLRCSFCNKTQDQVKKLIAGHDGVYICDECVSLCMSILEDEFLKKGTDSLKNGKNTQEEIKLPTPVGPSNKTLLFFSSTSSFLSSAPKYILL